MPTPQEQADTQRRNIEQATGKTVADFAAAATAAGVQKHGAIVTFLKSEHGLTHGNANLLAHLIREREAGGPQPDGALLDAQYAGPKARLRPIHDRVAALAADCGDDVTRVVQKTGVSFRRVRQFALIQAPSSKRVTLGLNLRETPDDDRISGTTGMCRQRVILTSSDDIDDAVSAWISESYAANG